MKPVINIKFDQNSHGVFYGGQVVTGVVDVSFVRAKKVRGILLNITGYASTRFRARRGEGIRRRRRKVCSGREQYVSHSEYLYGSGHASATEIQPGTYTYRFSCQLPQSAPSSFESTFGHIRYIAKVVLDRPWKFDQTFSQGFTVLNTLDLNLESPNIRKPFEVNAVKSFWGGLLTMAPLTVKVSVPQTGFVSGQVIPIHVDVDNSTIVPIKKVRFNLRQIITYYADKPYPGSRTRTIRISSAQSPLSLIPKGTITLDEKLHIPPLPPTTILHSSIIKISYEIKVDFVVVGLHKNPILLIPITIGTLPLFSVPTHVMLPPERQQTTLATTTLVMPSTSSMPVMNSTPAMSSANIPPPSYEEAVLMERGQLDDGEEGSTERSDFVPRYPVYESVPMISQNTNVNADTHKEKIVI